MTDEFDLNAYDFELPTEQIAQQPADARDASRMLVIDRATGDLADLGFVDIVNALRAGDILVLNNTRVIPARLLGTRRPGGGRAELFLVRPESLGVWVVLGRPGKKLTAGTVVDLPQGHTATVESVDESGRRIVRFENNGAPFASQTEESEFFDAAGQMPLPPYIERAEPADVDRERYQTVFAAERGAIAAPTAGLHFTTDVLDRLRARGVETAEVTLHVGYGTFEPVRTDDLRSHAVASEEIEVSGLAAEQINRARRRGGRVVAVGTTTARTLESACDEKGLLHPFRGPTDLTILPGASFRAIDGLLTNFHLPKSSLLVLVSTFAEREQIRDAYQYAIAKGYRFYSYGDCMLIL